jgi:hypothetical protein
VTSHGKSKGGHSPSLVGVRIRHVCNLTIPKHDSWRSLSNSVRLSKCDVNKSTSRFTSHGVKRVMHTYKHICATIQHRHQSKKPQLHSSRDRMTTFYWSRRDRSIFSPTKNSKYSFHRNNLHHHTYQPCPSNIVPIRQRKYPINDCSSRKWNRSIAYQNMASSREGEIFWKINQSTSRWKSS